MKTEKELFEEWWHKQIVGYGGPTAEHVWRAWQAGRKSNLRPVMDELFGEFMAAAYEDMSDEEIIESANRVRERFHELKAQNIKMIEVFGAASMFMSRAEKMFESGHTTGERMLWLEQYRAYFNEPTE